MPTTPHEQQDRQLFNEVADDYYAKDLHPASRPARRLRLLQTLRAVPLPKAASILEVGCGTGFAASYLAGRYRRYCGLDYAEELIRWAKADNSLPGASFRAMNIKDYSAEEPFDVVLMVGVLHHFDDPASILPHIANQVRPGGWILANEPHPGNPLVRLARQVRKRVDSDYSSGQRELSAGELRELYEGAGLTDIRIRPQGLVSTPFAEVPMRPRWLSVPLARLACVSDRVMEACLGRALHCVSWNLIVAGRRP